MCATIEGDVCEEDLITAASAYLQRVGAPGSDPGLCVANACAIQEPELLSQWGHRALSEVLTKQEAYELAKRCAIHLSEHGGDGQGVVGSLAAVGLRLSGNHGRVRGKRQVSPGAHETKELLDTTKFDCIRIFENDTIGEQLPANATVFSESGAIKAIYRDFQTTVLAAPRKDGTYIILEKQQLKAF